MSVYSPLAAIFLHIPKTGGTSVSQWLTNNTPGCITYPYTHPKLSELNYKHPHCYTFTLVRNPWSRIVSFYKYFSNRYLNGCFTINDAFPTFDDFIFNYLDKDIASLNYQLTGQDRFDYWFSIGTPQISWIDSTINQVIKLEQLSTDFIIVQKMFNCYQPINHLRSTTSDTPYQNYYNSQTKKIINDKFLPDIETFKYSF